MTVHVTPKKFSLVTHLVTISKATVVLYLNPKGRKHRIDVLWQRYAHRYQRNKFKGYMKTIMNNYNAKKSHDPCSLVPWEESSSRKRIIKDLKDYKSSLHKQVKDLEKNLENIWKEYAPQYQRSKFKGYMDTIMLNYWAKKGPFKDTWYAKKDGSHSKGYSLLYQLMMNNDISAVSKARFCILLSSYHADDNISLFCRCLLFKSLFLLLFSSSLADACLRILKPT